MKINKKIRSFFEPFTKWLLRNNNLLSLIIALISLFIAYKSMILADKSIQYSVEQNKLNSKLSDSLFRVQLSNAKSLNDSLIDEIDKLRRLTDNQLNLSQNQLTELKNLSKPKIVISRFYYDGANTMDSINGWISNYGFNGMITLKNNGTREAINITYKSCLIDSESYKISTVKESRIITKLDPDDEYNFYPQFNSPFKLHNNYHIYIRLNYFDPVLGRLISNKYFYTYSENGTEWDGNISKSTPDVSTKLEKIIE